MSPYVTSNRAGNRPMQDQVAGFVPRDSREIADGLTL